MIVLAARHSTKLSACSSQQNLIRLAHPLSSESFTKGRRTLLKIAAVATAALEIFGASCLFGWFARFDDFSVAFLERIVLLNSYKITSTLKLKSLLLTYYPNFLALRSPLFYTGAHTYNCRTR